MELLIEELLHLIEDFLHLFLFQMIVSFAHCLEELHELLFAENLMGKNELYNLLLEVLDILLVQTLQFGQQLPYFLDVEGLLLLRLLGLFVWVFDFVEKVHVVFYDFSLLLLLLRVLRQFLRKGFWVGLTLLLHLQSLFRLLHFLLFLGLTLSFWFYLNFLAAHNFLLGLSLLLRLRVGDDLGLLSLALGSLFLLFLLLVLVLLKGLQNFGVNGLLHLIRGLGGHQSVSLAFAGDRGLGLRRERVKRGLHFDRIDFAVHGFEVEVVVYGHVEVLLFLVGLARNREVGDCLPLTQRQPIQENLFALKGGRAAVEEREVSEHLRGLGWKRLLFLEGFNLVKRVFGSLHLLCPFEGFF